jgi:diguanylate cyclase (GGDEF)-like protein
MIDNNLRVIGLLEELKLFKPPAEVKNAHRYGEILKELRHAYLHDWGTDQLTGLPNRRRFEEEVKLLIQRASREITVLIADLDNFGEINKEHGHHVGDQVLRETAKVFHSPTQLIATSGRHTPTEWKGKDERRRSASCRHGGEEFVVCVVDQKYAQGYAEQIRKKVEAKRFREYQNLRVTVSIGVASTTVNKIPLKILLYRADQALNRAKNQGKNQVVVD